MEVTDEDLVGIAKEVAEMHDLSPGVKTGEVGCALLTENGNIYKGVNIRACCGIGFCAEHSAIASMVTSEEYRIDKIVAVSSDGKILPPCGRCREMIYQINNQNLDTKVIVGEDETQELSELLPERWQESF